MCIQKTHLQNPELQKTHLQSKSTEYNIKNNSKSMGLGSYWGEVLDVEKILSIEIEQLKGK